MEEKLNNLLEHVKENTKYLYPKDISNETLIQNLFGKGVNFISSPNNQNVVDLCTIALVLHLRSRKDVF